MTSLTSPPAIESDIFYPSSDSEPLAETSDHVLALLTIFAVLTQYLQGQQAIVLADQFFYYSQGFPRLRVAPDVMVVFNVSSGSRDNYKLWEEGEIPSVVFEVTSNGTQDRDQGFKLGLYEQLGVSEYWLFDPKNEWIEGQLQGYRLQNDAYVPVSEPVSEALGLRLAVEGKLLGFYRVDSGERLLIPDELAAALKTESQRRLEAEEQAEAERQRAEAERQRAETERQRAETLESQLAAYRERFGELNGDTSEPST
ncbi:MAG: Uma2 family endonuclease [Cyanobacteria bacterium J06638_22]